MQIETQLAQVSLDRVSRRDASKQYHKMSAADLKNGCQTSTGQPYLKKLGAPKFTEVNVAHPDFFKGVDPMLKSVSIDDWKTLPALAPRARRGRGAFGPLFVNENFNFYSKFLNGTKEIQPRWRRCVVATDQTLGEALGEVYVKKAFRRKPKRA